jgi:general secretion pathway protein N
VGRWPASWLVGLGAPFNTLRLGGALRLTADTLAVESVQGRWRVSGTAELELLGLSSPLTSLDTLGSYRLLIVGDGAGAEGARLNLDTLQGPLRLAGQGQWVGPKLRFRGDARADPGSEALLNNLLNLMGQRQGALALLAIG